MKRVVINRKTGETELSCRTNEQDDHLIVIGLRTIYPGPDYDIELRLTDRERARRTAKTDNGKADQHG